MAAIRGGVSVRTNPERSSLSLSLRDCEIVGSSSYELLPGCPDDAGWQARWIAQVSLYREASTQTWRLMMEYHRTYAQTWTTHSLYYWPQAWITSCTNSGACEGGTDPTGATLAQHENYLLVGRSSVQLSHPSFPGLPGYSRRTPVVSAVGGCHCGRVAAAGRQALWQEGHDRRRGPLGAAAGLPPAAGRRRGARARGAKRPTWGRGRA